MIIGVLDSGIGGVAVMKELTRLPWKNRYIYYSDNSYAPYGSLNETVLTARLAELSKLLVERGAEAILLLCNTATTVALETLKKNLSVPVFGVRPRLSDRKGKTLVLSTMLTAKRLLQEVSARDNVEILGLRSLSLEIEAAAPEFTALRPYLENLLAPYKSCETVMLACTHYLHLAPIIQEILPAAKLCRGVEPLIKSVCELSRRKEEARAEISAATDPQSILEDNKNYSETNSQSILKESGNGSETEFIFSGENKEKLYRAVLTGR